MATTKFSTHRSTGDRGSFQIHDVPNGLAVSALVVPGYRPRAAAELLADELQELAFDVYATFRAEAGGWGVTLRGFVGGPDPVRDEVAELVAGLIGEGL